MTTPTPDATSPDVEAPAREVMEEAGCRNDASSWPRCVVHVSRWRQDEGICEDAYDHTERVLDALHDLLRADTPAGDALRERLGLREEAASAWSRIGSVEMRRLVTDWEPLP